MVITIYKMTTKYDQLIAETKGVKITSDKTPEVAEIVQEANEIFAVVSKSKIGELEKVAEGLYDTHKSFFQTYPVVIRYMMSGVYNPVAFGKWLNTLRGVDWKSEKKFLESQAHYFYILQEVLDPRGDKRLYKERSEQLFKSLVKEREDHKKSVEKAQEVVKAQESERIAQHKKDLVEHLIKKAKK